MKVTLIVGLAVLSGLGTYAQTNTAAQGRGATRIQAFDQDGSFIEQFLQFSRPSRIAVDKDDVIYVSDSESESVSRNHDGWKRGIRVGSLKDGKVTAFAPGDDLWSGSGSQRRHEIR